MVKEQAMGKETEQKLATVKDLVVELKTEVETAVMDRELWMEAA